MKDDWSSEETDDPLYADRRNRIFERAIKHRPRISLTIRHRTRVLQQWPQK
jgi:hypothetical protein